MKKIASKSILLLNILSSVHCIAQAPLIKQWDYRFGGDSTEAFYSFQLTANGGYILGGFSISDSSGDKTQHKWGGNGSGSDYWIVKTDSLGIKQWDKRFGGTFADNLHRLQQTNDGGYILGGSSVSGISGDVTQPNHGTGAYGDYWIVKTDSVGIKQWDKRFGGALPDDLWDLEQTKDGGFILGGASQSDYSGDKTQPIVGSNLLHDYWIVKTDSLGIKEWDKDFGGTKTDKLWSLQQTSDGGYILGGSSNSDSTGDKTQHNWDTILNFFDYWILKIDSLGTKQWDKRFGGTKEEQLRYIHQTIDGGYILGGWSFSGVTGDKTQPNRDTSNTTCDYWIVKTDSLGVKQWDKRFGGTGSDALYSVRQTSDGGYLLGGQSSSSPASGDKSENNLGPTQTWIVKINSIGEKEWDKTIFTDSIDGGGYAIEIPGPCYVIANNSKSTPVTGGYKTQPPWTNNYDYWIIKFCDSTGWSSAKEIQQQQLMIYLFPNPTNSSLKVEINSLKEEPSEMILQNVLGQKIFSKHLQLHTGKNNSVIDVSAFARGIYVLQIKTKERSYVSKVVKG